jgi:predicted Zn finger-like uncharacterized protein
MPLTPIITDCPSCSRKVRVPEELLGKLVRCPTCGHTFTASLTPAQTDAGDNPHPGDRPPTLELDEPAQVPQTGESPPEPASAPEPVRRQSPDDLQPCPYCGERIAANALRCKYCGEVLDEEEEDDERPWEESRRRFRGRRDAEPHRGVLILVLGIISIVLAGFVWCSVIGLPLGIAAWVMGQADLRKIRNGSMDPEGEGLTQAGKICGIIGTILDSLCGLGVLLYFGFIFTWFGAMRNNPGGPFVAPVPPVPPPKKVPAGFVPERLRDYLPPRLG